MTAIIRGVPCSDAGSTLPVAAPAWQNQAHAEIVGLWDRVPITLTATSGVNDIVCSVNVQPPEFKDGMAFWLTPLADNTSAVTVKIGARDPIALCDAYGDALTGGELAAGRRDLVICDGSVLRLIAGAGAGGGAAVAPDCIWIDRKTSGTDGGTFTNGAWRSRAVNYEIRNELAGASLDAGTGRFTLPAGTHLIKWAAPARGVSGHRSALYNVSDSTFVEEGSSDLTSSAVTTWSSGIAVVTITATKVFEVRHVCQATYATTGMGQASSLGSYEYYTRVEVTRVGTTDDQVYGIPGGRTLTYLFSTTTTAADPGDGRLRLNSSTQSSATAAYIDLLDYALQDRTAILDAIDDSTSIASKAIITFSKRGDPSRWLECNVTALTVASGYRNLALAVTASSHSSPFVDGDLVYVSVQRTGDKGDTGPTDAGFRWLLSGSTSMADPGAGYVRLNNATMASVTAIAFSATANETGSPDVSDYVASWDDVGSSTVRGDLIIKSTQYPDRYVVFRVNGTVADNGSWLQVSATYVARAGTISASDRVTVQFLPGGAAGVSNMRRLAYVEYATNEALTGTIPLDDTIPQNTEGTEIATATFTPSSATARVRMRFSGQAAMAAAGNVVVAFFAGAAAGAIAATRAYCSAAADGVDVVLEKEFVPGVTTPVTVSVRSGPGASGTVRFNGTTSGRNFGGAASALLIVDEITP